VGIHLSIGIGWIFADMLRDMFRLKPNNQATKNAVVATLSDPYSWTFKGREIHHSSGLVLSVNDGIVSADGLFNCCFSEAESIQLLKSIDLMRSAKLTTSAVKVLEKPEEPSKVVLEINSQKLIEDVNKMGEKARQIFAQEVAS